ncbi:anti-sigma factor domain-containing protein [Isoptericola nanjingensis]|uniref:anti-sigma factor domain-containing protein n=1 Tax=Isoptericola TaxID=254250 RepID=UPI0035EFC35F|nr:anti-sigma factor [Isoptericola sp. QY 916]
MPHIDDETLALCALGEDVLDPAQRDHLAGCPACAATVRDLERVSARMRAPGTAPELVPPGPEVWARVHAELGLRDVPASQPPDQAPAPVTDQLAARRARRSWVPALVAACTALVLGLVGGVLWERRTLEPAETTVASATLDPLPDWAGSSGEAVLRTTADGRREIVVSVDAPAPEGTYREVWLLTPDVSGLVSLGVLESGEGRFDVPEGLDLAAYSVVDVSEEPLDGDPAHSSDSVVRGSLAT